MHDLTRIFPGDSDMARRMRVFDWTLTPLGPAALWPNSLCTSIRIILTSRHPMFVWWGEELINLYNDGYAEFLHSRHPAALGRPAAAVWPEIWDEIGPRALRARSQDAGTYDEALPFVMLRKGYPEETYVTFSYSPIPNDDGGPGGILCPVTEDTQRIVGERQLTLLRELASRTTNARTPHETCMRAMEALATNPADLPFALIYQLEGSDEHPRVKAYYGVIAEAPTMTDRLAVEHQQLWPIAKALQSKRHVLVSDLSSIASWLPTIRGSFQPEQAVVIPLLSAGQPSSGRAVLVAGLNPLRRYNDDYKRFMELVAGGITAGLNNAARTAAEHALVASRDALERRVLERTAALQASEEKIRTLFETMAEGFCLLELVHDDHGAIRDLIFREVNASFKRQSGIHEVVGKTVRELLPHLERSWIDLATHVSRTGDPVVAENYSKDRDRWYRMHQSRVGGAGSAFVAVVLEDVTARKRAEMVLQESRARQTFLLALSDALRPLTDPAEVQSTASRLLGQHLGVSRAFYFAVEAQDGGYTHAVEKEFVFAESAFADLHRGKAVVVSNVNRLSVLSDAERSAHLAARVQAFIAVPLVKRGEFVGGFVTLHSAPRDWSEQEIALVHETAERTWAAVERARAEEALRHSEARLKQLNDQLEHRIRERTTEINELFARLVSAQEEERGRIARDIHDQIGQVMTALRMNIEAMQWRSNGQESLTEHTERVQRLAEELDQNIDFLTWHLRPAALDLGLTASLTNLVSGWSERFGIKAELDVPNGDGVRLPRDAEANLYRVVQEALHNVVKHADATHVTVVVGCHDREVVLLVEDNGRGFDVAETYLHEDGTGLGLLSMRERATLAGGRLEIESTPNVGTTIFVRVPIRQEELS